LGLRVQTGEIKKGKESMKKTTIIKRIYD